MINGVMSRAEVKRNKNCRFVSSGGIEDMAEGAHGELFQWSDCDGKLIGKN